MTTNRTFTKKLAAVSGISLLLLVSAIAFSNQSAPFTSQKVAAACSPTAPATTNGQVVQTFNASSAGTYRVWSRVKAANTTANAYYFRLDTGCTYTVGSSASIPTSSWSWVNYQDGATNSYVDVALSAGQHTITYSGKETGMQVDKMMLLVDTGCVPTGQGDNCGVADNTPPTTLLTSPLNGAVIRGTTTFTASALDNLGVTKVEFYVNGQLRGSDSAAPYTYDFNADQWPNGTYTVQTKAVDGSENIGSSATASAMVDNDPKVSMVNNLLKGRTFTSTVGDSTSETGNPLKNINDGNEFSRWISTPTDNANLTVDLGTTYTLGKVSILWAADTVKTFEIQMSADNSSWKSIYSGTTNNTQRQLLDLTSFSSMATGRYLRVIAKDRWNASFGNSIWEIGAYTSASNPMTPVPVLSSDGGIYISDLRPTFALNGWGPYEKNMSNGDNAAQDGRPLTVKKVVYQKGLGIHANAEIIYQIGGTKTNFKSIIGMDDETGTDDSAQGAVQYEVWGDGKRLYQSSVIKHSNSGQAISVDVTGVSELRLVVNDGGDGSGNDHADWADARLFPGTGGIVTPPTPTPTTDAVKPVVSLTAPNSGVTVTKGTGLTISATASDNVAVVRVEMLVNGNVVSNLTSSPYNYSWNTSSLAAGTYSISARAYDAAGNASTSTPVSVSITAGTTGGSGDVNGDARINALDLSALISHDGQNYPAADFNKDGTVGAADMAILLAKWTW